MYVKKFFENDASVPSQTEAFVLNCLNWQERNPDRTLILIGDDISKGVVPTNRKVREWRDMTGLLYQRLIQASERSDILWYSISKQLKYDAYNMNMYTRNGVKGQAVSLDGSV